MPSVTKTALCTVDYCPAKNDPWWHACVVCENNVIEHAHIIARSQAPERRNDPNNVIPLCHREHDLVSRHIWTFVEQALPFGGVHQWLRDERGVTRWSRDIGASSDGEDVSGVGEQAPVSLRSETGALSPSLKAPYTFGDNGIEWEPEFTFDDWARAAQRVMKESVGRQWRVGDLVNAERWAECSQFYDDLGYPPETQANYGRISAAYKLAERAPLPWTYHQAVYKHPERLALLDAAVENKWDRAELRKQAGYEKRSGLRRFTIEELRALEREWFAGMVEDGFVEAEAAKFIDWLGATHG